MSKIKDRYLKVIVKADEEFRLIIDQSLGEEALIELLDGSAEVFGVEMIHKRLYTFSTSLTVFTRNGCTLRLGGNPSDTYSVKRSKSSIDNIHAQLEDQRTKAQQNNTRGPITLITGPKDVGKSTLTRTLLNYAAQSGRKPLYFDLDVGQSSISIPSTMGVLPIDGPEDLEKGFDDNDLSVYFFGYTSPGLNIGLYYLLIQKLGQSLHRRMGHSKSIKHSGAIIDTCGWVEGQGYQSILAAARSFDISLAIVLSDNKLYSRLRHDLSPRIKIKFCPSLEGIVERSQVVRRHRRENLIHEYFYGTPQRRFGPHTIQLMFSDVEIVQVVTPKLRISIDLLDEIYDAISVVSVPISPSLCNQVLAISHTKDHRSAMIESVLGFICILQVDMERKLLTVLSPQPDLMKKRILVMGDLQFDVNRYR
ncbi:hypothetical protein JTE90_005878 [Oedothorax gibbosus]|uniref:Protein CLP1 homolog n=1 Tax=Oedothorax gibbosus TaxID=931172 RepID=A0AAV6URW1_9ARAC|nr:hypothetical protein JTE90_005878 [Oedothorax gibbosus]